VLNWVGIHLLVPAMCHTHTGLPGEGGGGGTVIPRIFHGRLGVY
jgi:hypothetical protein